MRGASPIQTDPKILLSAPGDARRSAQKTSKWRHLSSAATRPDRGEIRPPKTTPFHDHVPPIIRGGNGDSEGKYRDRGRSYRGFRRRELTPTHSSGLVL